MARTSKQALERRLSPKSLKRIYDDNHTGNSDNDAVEQLLEDAEAKVNSYLAPLGLLPFAVGQVPREVTRLDLDVAVAYAAQRHPEANIGLDWIKLMEQAEKDLCRLRDGKTMLGESPPDPAANHGGAIFDSTTSGGASSTSTVCRDGGFWEKMGDF